MSCKRKPKKVDVYKKRMWKYDSLAQKEFRIIDNSKTWKTKAKHSYKVRRYSKKSRDYFIKWRKLKLREKR